MQIEIRMDETCTEPKIIIQTSQMTDELRDILDRLSGEKLQVIAGFRHEEVTLLDQADIYRIYSADGKVFAATREREYQLRLRLYELETRLDKKTFVRISHSEIVNLKKVKGFDLSLAGTIRVSLMNGTVTYVSRRYVSKIKQVLGV